jgi:hypothetical protein
MLKPRGYIQVSCRGVDNGKSGRWSPHRPRKGAKRTSGGSAMQWPPVNCDFQKERYARVRSLSNKIGADPELRRNGRGDTRRERSASNENIDRIYKKDRIIKQS